MNNQKTSEAGHADLLAAIHVGSIQGQAGKWPSANMLISRSLSVALDKKNKRGIVYCVCYGLGAAS
jgi:hypothetical protein